MEQVLEKNKCTGCTACMNICPKGAISMVEGEDGFKYPVIDQDKCINCGLCKKTCPVINTKENKSLNKCYVAFNKDEETRLKSSSGGIFSLIANYILEQKGLVIGAAFNENNELKHIAIEKKKELPKLMGSKYLQSDLNNIFKYIKENIKEKKILFVGTPCQIGGLKAFIKKDYDNLICIDLVCHGVPSPKLFKKYIEELEKENGKLINYNFRDNSTGWDTYSNTATFKNKTITEDRKENNYMKLFLSDIALRQSCFNCNFKLGNKYSDITLGDFWGIKNHYPEMYNKTGVSAIIINTEKGNEIFKEIINNLEYKECKLEEIVSGNPSIKISGKEPKNRNKFFKEIDKLSVQELSNKYKKKFSILNKIKRKIKSLIK